MQKFPSLSIIVVTYNNTKTLPRCLEAIAAQDYPQNKIEYINVDGGSTDTSTELCQQYGFKTVKSPIPHNAEAQRAVGIRRAKNELIVSIDADNYMPTKNWLREMVEPFQEKDIIYSGTLHYTYTRSTSIYSRYFALFGVNDPVVFYIGKPDRNAHYNTKVKFGKVLANRKHYFKVQFNEENLPTVGCNGVVFRREIMLKYAHSLPKEYFHIDVFVDLVRKGYDKFALVKNSVVHDTATTLPYLMKKRVYFLTHYYLDKDMRRRYFIYNPQKKADKINLLKYAFYTVTFVKPLFDAAKGFATIPDLAWFLHPFMCWLYLIAYGIPTVKNLQKKS